MLDEIVENRGTCPYCHKWANFITVDNTAVKRTYCDRCLADIEIIWKERR